MSFEKWKLEYRKIRWKKSRSEVSLLERLLTDWEQIGRYEAYQKLIKHLDNSSVEIVNRILSQANFCIEKFQKPRNVFRTAIEKQTFDKLESEFYRLIMKLNNNCYVYKSYFLPKNHFEVSTFYYEYNMDEFKTLLKIREKNIVDVQPQKKRTQKRKASKCRIVFVRTGFLCLKEPVLFLTGFVRNYRNK